MLGMVLGFRYLCFSVIVVCGKSMLKVESKILGYG